jgi:hypothetical protein
MSDFCATGGLGVGFGVSPFELANFYSRSFFYMYLYFFMKIVGVMDSRIPGIPARIFHFPRPEASGRSLSAR